jgi:hypothetical protein
MLGRSLTREKIYPVIRGTKLICLRHLVKSDPPTFKFCVECACKPDKMYDTEEKAIQAFNEANAPEKKKAYR